MSLLSSLSTMKRASATDFVAKIEMTPAQVEDIMNRLKEQNRMCVYPNRFDISKPFRVQTRIGNGAKAVWNQHGYFTNVDVASAVGTICSKAMYGDKALAGEFNAEVVENHEEFKAWLLDDRNQAVIKAASTGSPVEDSAPWTETEATVAPTPSF